MARKRAPRPFVVIGNPGHRRVELFQAALAAQQLPAAQVIAWRALAEPGAPARLLSDLPADAILRIDSMGEDDAVERAMLGRGHAAAVAEGVSTISAAELAAQPYDLGRIICPRQLHLGFLAVLGEVEAAIAEHGARWRVTQPVQAIRDLFDKRVTSKQWAARGIPVPWALPDGIRDPKQLRQVMREQQAESVYVKLASGSSASCLAIFRHDPRGEQVITTVEDTGTARYNTRKLQRLTQRPAIDKLLGFLLREGAQIERAMAKPMVDRRYFDLRVLTIDGVPAFVVMRTSPHPITNLHLGGQRGDVEELKTLLAPGAWDAAMASCIAVQRDSGAFQVGVDLMFATDLFGHYVIEGNAFGDLLPNLERDGLDVYGWQIARLTAD